MRPSRRSTLAACAALVALSTSVVLSSASPASGSTPTWSPAGPCGTVATTVAPAGIVSMNVIVAGGPGGKGGGQSSGTTGPGGAGGSLWAVIPVAPGSTISAVVGCAGRNGSGSGSTPGVAGFASGGGTGHGQNTVFDPTGAGGGSGGGASAVCLGANCATGVGTPLVVAGGGGGSGSSSCSGTTGGAGGIGGSAGGTSGGGGSGPSGANGGNGASAGSQTSSIPGGPGGRNSSGGSGNGGSSPNGSGGASVNVVGGGGGGGFVGGGAGANASTGCKAGGAGGGGSSWVASSASFAVFGSAPNPAVLLNFNYGVPTAPRSPSATPGDAYATVKWTPPVSDGGSPITGYVVTPLAGSRLLPQQTFGPGATSGIVTGLTNGTAYRFQIRAVADGGTSSPATTGEIVAGTPLAPASVSLRTTDGGASLKWTPPTSDNGWPPSSYVVTPYIGVTPQTPTTFDAPALSGTVTGLTNGLSYTFRVAATNQYGTGVRAVTGSIIAGAPTNPPWVNAVAGTGNATVWWGAPNDNGSPISGYVVTPYIGAVAQLSRTFNSAATTQVITGLTPGTTYTFRVAAINANGTGNPNTSSAVTIG